MAVTVFNRFDIPDGCCRNSIVPIVCSRNEVEGEEHKPSDAHREEKCLVSNAIHFLAERSRPLDPILRARPRLESKDSDQKSQSTPSEYRVECADLLAGCFFSINVCSGKQHTKNPAY